MEKATGIKANLVSIYISLGARISSSAISAICAKGALPIVEIDSDNSAITTVTSGAYDSVLAAYAKEIGALKYPVGIDFDHEFNGPWFHWGYKYETAQQFVAAWRHVVDVFRQNGANNVTWIWNPNVGYSDTVALAPWYPGNSYVTWVGLDGYFYTPTDTFHSVFDKTLAQVQKFSSKPVLIMESGANPTSQRTRAIKSLFAGVSSKPNILGLIWFDYNKTSSHNWYINNDPSALSAFRAGAKSYISEQN